MWEEILESFFAQHPWRPQTEAQYRRILTMFLHDVPDPSPKAFNAVDFKRWLEQHAWGENMRWIAFIAIRNFLKWRYGAMHPALLLRIRRSEGRPQRALHLREIRSLLGALDLETAKGKRDRAIILFLLDTGVRASELCRLSLKYLDLEERSFSVEAKGGRWHSGVFSHTTARALEEWLKVREARPRVDAVFVGVGGSRKGLPLTRYGLKTILRKLGIQAGIGPVAPHDFRRTFATWAIRQGAPTRLVQVQGGWKHLEMVERYTRSIEAKDFEPYFPSNLIAT